MSSIVFTLKRSSRARAIAYRTNSDFEGKPCSFDAAASSFACSFVSLRLIVCTRIVIRRYYLTLMTSFVNLKSPPRVGAYCDDLHRLSAQSRHSYFTGVVRGRIREGSVSCPNSCDVSSEIPKPIDCRRVDNVVVPIPHLGALASWDHFQMPARLLRDAVVPSVISPRIHYEDNQANTPRCSSPTSAGSNRVQKLQASRPSFTK